MDKRIRFRANELDTIEKRELDRRNRHFLSRSFYRRTYPLVRYMYRPMLMKVQYETIFNAA